MEHDIGEDLGTGDRVIVVVVKMKN